MRTTRRPPTQMLYQDKNISLVIRPLRKEDAAILNAAVQESIENLLPFMNWAHGEQTEKNQYQRILASIHNYSQGTEYDFGVFDRTGEFLVSASWHSPKTASNKKCLEIGYWTHAKHCNKGLATLITKILTVAAFEVMACDRVEIGCNKANAASRKVIEKCDFILEKEIPNYFPKPTDEMLARGHTQERTSLQFVLKLVDLPNLSWYPEIKKHLEIL